jgi:hypothetical protein
MRLNYHQQRQLRLIEARLRRADPHLGSMLGIFGRLYPDQKMPGWEQVPQTRINQGRLRRAAAGIMAMLVAMVAAISVLLGQAVIAASARLRHRVPAPPATREPTRPSSDELA